MQSAVQDRLRLSQQQLQGLNALRGGEYASGTLKTSFPGGLLREDASHVSELLMFSSHATQRVINVANTLLA